MTGLARCACWDRQGSTPCDPGSEFLSAGARSDVLPVGCPLGLGAAVCSFRCCSAHTAVLYAGVIPRADSEAGEFPGEAWPASRSCNNSREMGRLLHTVPSSRVLEGFEECCPCPYVPLFLLIAAGLQKNPLSPKRSGRCPERGQAGRGSVPWDPAMVLRT